MLTQKIETWDERRQYVVPGNTEETIRFAAEHWIHSAKRSIQRRGRFAVALSGGSTPKAIFQLLSTEKELEWDKVYLFWSDERGVPPNHPDSNYHMAMESGLKNLPIPEAQIFRMAAEHTPEAKARDYEDKIGRILDKNFFDLVMLGVGEDGHTASLFPHSPALEIQDRLVYSQFLPEKNSWRMTLTFRCINESQQAVIYALGPSKASIVPTVLNAALVSPYPASRIGTPSHPALWMLDAPSALNLKKIST